ncbi:FtsX-like permease family protein [Longispora sp. K20-0274]|uniref:ABC transporter permease n=1 Tax=Longispora sp. K20-0274 TaxID=3088255 RepID=UPI003999DE0F
MTLRHSVKVRMRIGDRWQPLLLFVIAPDDPLRIAAFTVEHGRWPTAPDGLLLERSSLAYFGLRDGETLTVWSPHGTPQPITVAGSAHDPSLAPSQQETVGYGYLTPAAFARLGEDPALTDLKITTASADPAEIERAARRMSATLTTRGVGVERIMIPPPNRHPHQSQMETVATLLLVFGGMSMLLSAVLVATMLGGMLAGQIRQIGVMKAVGARTGQVLRLYLVMTLLIATAATALALLPGLALARLLARTVAGLLNIDLVSTAVPGWVYAAQIGSGVAVPLLVALVPLVRGSRVTVREAIADHGVAAPSAARDPRRARGNRLALMAWRNTFRRKGRLVLVITLLGAAGAMFLTGMNTAAGWSQMVRDGLDNRHYDLDIGLNRPASADTLTALLAPVPGVSAVEAWTTLPATLAQPGEVDISHAYPDGGHGSFSVTALPPATSLLTLPLRSGRWLRPDDTDAVVINQLVPTYQRAGLTVGDDLTLTVAGATHTWHIVGTVSDFGTHGTVYVTPAGLDHAVGSAGQAQALRIVTTGHDQAARLAALDRVEQTLAAHGVSVQTAVPITQLQAALDGHVAVLIIDLLALATIMAIVGLLGLATTMSTNVTERTREFAIMTTLGATPTAVRRIVTTEGLLATAMSLLAAGVLSLPLTGVLGDFIGRQAFHLPLPFQFSPQAVVLWAAIAVGGAVAATTAAARRAGRLTVREALTHH